MAERIDDVMLEIRQNVEWLESSRPARVDAMISPESKLPFKALCFREGLIWRMAELSRGAYDHFTQNQLVNATLLTRGAVETSAAAWYLHAKIDASLQKSEVGDLDEYLMRLAVGSRTDTEMPSAISVLTFIDRMEKDVAGCKQQYELLSEIAHPNWAGTGLLYSKPDPENLWTDFRPYTRDAGPRIIGVMNLSVALLSFQHSYNAISDRMSMFMDLCQGRR